MTEYIFNIKTRDKDKHNIRLMGWDYDCDCLIQDKQIIVKSRGNDKPSVVVFHKALKKKYKISPLKYYEGPDIDWKSSLLHMMVGTLARVNFQMGVKE